MLKFVSFIDALEYLASILCSLLLTNRLVEMQ